MMGSRVTFGFGMVSAQHHPRDTRSDTQLYADLIDLCVHAERLGFDAVWMSEHHFVDDGYMPSLLPVLAAVAARTSRIGLGTGVLLAPMYHPLRLAEDTATVDVISGGRLILGMGAGYREEEFDGLGLPKTGLGTVIESTVSRLRAAWAGEAVSLGEGGTPVRVTPRPTHPAGPPIWLGARKKVAMRRAARIADGFFAARVSPAEFGEQVQVCRQELAAAGRKENQMTVGVHCPVFAWPGGSARTAWERVVDSYHYVEWKYVDMLAPYGTRTVTPELPTISEQTRDKLAAGAVVGTPEQVARTITQYALAAGGLRFHFTARLYWPGMDPDEQREAMTVFADEVIPQVRAAVDGARM